MKHIGFVCQNYLVNTKDFKRLGIIINSSVASNGSLTPVVIGKKNLTAYIKKVESELIIRH